MKVNWDEELKKLGKDLHSGAVDVLERNKDLFENLTKEQLLLLLNSIEDEDELNTTAYLTLLQQLDDQEFLKLRDKSIEGIKAWSTLDQKKKQFMDDLKILAKEKLSRFMIKVLLTSV